MKIIITDDNGNVFSSHQIDVKKIYENAKEMERHPKDIALKFSVDNATGDAFDDIMAFVHKYPKG